MTEETTENRPTSKANRVLLLVIGVLIVLALLAGGYYFLGMKPAVKEGDDTPETMSEVLTLEGEGPVARVNGVEISREEYRHGVEQLMSNYTAQGVTIKDEDAGAVKEQVINNLVDRQLLIAAAATADIQATDAEIEAEFQKVVANFSDTEGLSAALTKAGVTEQELRADLKTTLVINKYLATKASTEPLTITNEEVSAYYENAKKQAGSTEVPPLEEVADLIKNQLLVEKQQQALSAEVAKLRAGANIEVLI